MGKGRGGAGGSLIHAEHPCRSHPPHGFNVALLNLQGQAFLSRHSEFWNTNSIVDICWMFMFETLSDTRLCAHDQLDYLLPIYITPVPQVGLLPFLYSAREPSVGQHHTCTPTKLPTPAPIGIHALTSTALNSNSNSQVAV